MAHLAAWPGCAFAVKMHSDIPGLQQLGNPQHVVTDQVFHHHVAVAAAIAQRQTGHGADVLFELVDRASALRPVARIMDTRGDFVDK